MKNIDWKDVLVRAIKTFVETAVAAIVAGVSGVDVFATEEGFWIGLALSAGAAGVSAVWNGVVEPMIKLPEKKEA